MGSDELFNMELISLSSFGTYMLFDEINDMSAKSACEFILKSNLLFTDKDVMTMFINSPGGCVSDGFAIIDMMEASKVNIATKVVGEASSMGSMIFVAGTKGMRMMSPNSVLMSHQFSAYAVGKEHELNAVGRYHEIISEQIQQHLVKNTNMSLKQVKDILLGPSDNYLTANECKKYGICDVVTGNIWDKEPAKKPATKKKSTKAKPRSSARGNGGIGKATL